MFRTLLLCALLAVCNTDRQDNRGPAYATNGLTDQWTDLLCALKSSTASRTCYGDIMSLKPKGKADGGVAASITNVKYDLPLLNKRKSCYQAVADENCIQASVITAIASRESGGGASLCTSSSKGTGFDGAWGILQCDESSGLDCTSCAWDSCCHIRMMVSQLLVPYIKEIQRKHPDWTKAQQLQGGVAAYNFGTKNVWTWERLDIGTTFNDYSNDVIARAQYLYRLGWN